MHSFESSVGSLMSCQGEALDSTKHEKKKLMQVQAINHPELMMFHL